MKRLYLDIDGVLLGKRGSKVVLASHAEPFLDFILTHFECYWLTTHCHGQRESVLAYLAPYVSSALLKRLWPIQPTHFSTLKTEALAGDFYWIDDSPLACELTDLCRRHALDRWIEINTRVRPDDLLYAIDQLQMILSRRPAPPAKVSITPPAIASLVAMN